MGNNSTKPAGGPPSPISSFNTPSKKEPKSPSSHNHANTSAQQKYPQLENQPLYSSTSSPSHRQKAEDKMGNDQSKQSPYDGRKKERSRTSGKSTPVRVPRGSDPRRQRGPDSQFESSGPPRDPNYIPHSDLNFPPRLPLPIEEEVHAPYSPTITAEGFSSPLHEGDIDGPILRQSSAISNTTLEDDEEMGNELQPYPYEAPPKGTVPTLLQWTQGGEKVFVTGTFARWNIKFRMVRE